MAKMLSDDGLFAVADFVEARASCEVVTMEMLDTVRAVGKAHRLVALGEAMPGDERHVRAAAAPQVRVGKQSLRLEPPHASQELTAQPRIA